MVCIICTAQGPFNLRIAYFTNLVSTTIILVYNVIYKLYSGRALTLKIYLVIHFVIIANISVEDFL